MSQTQQNVYDVVELEHTHTRLLWWATKSGDILTAYNTYKHNFNSNFPMEIMIFGLFARWKKAPSVEAAAAAAVVTAPLRN